MSRQRTALGLFSQESHCFSKACERCGKPIRAGKRVPRFCSRKCYRSNTRYIDKAGYVCIKMPDHPHATTNGWVREHIVVACRTLDRALLPREEVHHKDEDKLNNAPGNLEVLTKSAHGRLHHGRPGNRQENEPNLPVPCGCGCAGTFLKYDRKGRPRRFLPGHNMNIKGAS